MTGHPPKLSLNFWIPLDSREVFLQLRQSLQQTRNDRGVLGWSVQFPLAISTSTNRFTILRTLYDVNEDSIPQIRSCILKMPGSWAWRQDDSHHHEILARLKGSTKSVISRYDYWFTFSADDLSLGLVVKEPKREGVWTYLSTRGDPGTPFLLLSSPGIDPFFSDLQPRIYFHPTLNIAVAKSHMHGLLGLIIWVFQPGKLPKASRAIQRQYYWL